MIATWVRAMTESSRCARQPSSAASRLLHDSGSGRYLSVTLMPAELGRRHAGVSAEEGAKIGRILESKLGRDAGHRTQDLHHAAARFQSQSLLDHVAGSTGAPVPADAGQAALRQRKLPTI